MPELMIGVSLKTKYKGKTIDEVRAIRNSFSEEANYNYNYMLAGYMRVAEGWMHEKCGCPNVSCCKERGFDGCYESTTT